MDGGHTTAAYTILPASLLDLLSNSIIFSSLVRHLPLASIFRLSQTCHTFRDLLLSSPETLQYVDLSRCKGAYMPLIQSIDRGGHSWRAERMDESLTEDEFYAGPLRGVLTRLDRMAVLTRVRTLVLDGLASVTNDLLSDIVTCQDYNVRLLSIRRCVNVNHPKLQQLLAYICRPSRPEGTPRLRGLYVFTDPIPPLPSIDGIAISVTEGGQRNSNANSASPSIKDSLVARLESWYAANGRILSLGHKQRSAWEETLQICKGIVWFDAVPCTHMHAAMSSVLHHHPGQDELNEKPGVSTIATIALGPNGCAGCRRAPEGTPIWGKSDISHFPLLWPPPHSGRLVDAIRPPVRYDPWAHEFSQRLIVSCSWCMHNRHCESCHKWWCTDCSASGVNNIPSHEPATVTGADTTASGGDSAPENFQTPVKVVACQDEAGLCFAKTRPVVSRECWECGLACSDCVNLATRECTRCKSSYCIFHNTGCDERRCDWCNFRGGRRTQELY